MLPLSLTAQVNTEALRVDTDESGFKGELALTGNVSAGNTSIYEINTGGRLDYIRPRNRSFIVYNYAYGYKNGEPFKNAAFIAFRNTWQWKPRLAVEGFVQQQQNEFIRLKDRKLVGGGVRLTAFDADPKPSGWHFGTYLGLAAMGEREVIDASGEFGRFTTNLIRSTNYLSLALSKGEDVDVTFVQYMQFVPNDVANYRYTADFNVDVSLNESLSWVFRLGYRRDNQPPAGVRPFDLGYTTGFSYEF